MVDINVSPRTDPESQTVSGHSVHLVSIPLNYYYRVLHVASFSYRAPAAHVTLNFSEVWPHIKPRASDNRQHLASNYCY